MLPGAHVPDLIRRGLGLAARGAGDWCDLYRARSSASPVTPANRIMRLPAAFVNTGNPAAPVGYGEATWNGIFDAAYTQAGDYLGGRDGLFFIASQPRLGPILCVKTTRVLTFSRPAAPQAAGLDRYGGVRVAETEVLLDAWPASVLARSRDGGRGALPADAPGLPGGAGGWEALLPAYPGVLLRPGDLARDDIGRNAVVSSAELTALGWRLFLRQAST
jgi:hypothetical protein